MGFRIFDRIFKRREARRDEHYYPDDYYEDEPPQEEDLGLLVDHHFVYPPEDDYDKNIGGMKFVVEIENNTDYPMGNLSIKMDKGFKMGSFGQPQQTDKLLDPGMKTKIEVPFKPHYVGGKDQFEFEISFFDFKYKVEERITLRSEPLKVLVPKFKSLDKDEDGYRLLTGDLYRWVMETDVVKLSPQDIFGLLSDRLESIGFSTCDEMVNDSLFRGIKKFAATDKKGRKWAAQIQVIGKDDESKILVYTYGERPLLAYNLAVKILLKLDEKETLIGALEV